MRTLLRARVVAMWCGYYRPLNRLTIALADTLTKPRKGGTSSTLAAGGRKSAVATSSQDLFICLCLPVASVSALIEMHQRISQRLKVALDD